MSPRGFTLLETMMTIAIVGVLFFTATYGLSVFQRSFAAQTVDRELTSVISTAARRARMGMSNDSWGVYIPYDSTTRLATTMTLFHGTSYAARVAADDQVYSVNKNAKFISVDFSGAAADTGNDHEIVFQSLDSDTAQYGSVIIEWYGKQRTVTIDSDGFAIRSSL